MDRMVCGVLELLTEVLENLLQVVMSDSIESLSH